MEGCRSPAHLPAAYSAAGGITFTMPPARARAPVRRGSYPAARGTTSCATWSITSRTPEAVGWKTSQMISVTPAAA